MIIRGVAGKKIPHSRIVKDVQNFVKLSDEEITTVINDNHNKQLLTDA